MNGMSRRAVMGAGVGIGLTLTTGITAGKPAAASPSAAPAAATAPRISAGDEAAWADIARLYDTTDEVVQLENGNWGAMARPVLEAYTRHLGVVNRRTSFYSRREFLPDLIRARNRAATQLGCQPEELAFTRGATESLLGLISGYNRLRPGDGVLYADLDYDSMRQAMGWLKDRRGAVPITLDLPLPASWQGVIDAYDQALAAHPSIRMMLLTHVSHRTGLVLPVAEIVALARARGVDVIVDSAHAWGQLDFRLPDLGADFVGLTCQKWIGAPMGLGLTYIRRDRLTDIDPVMGIVEGRPDDAMSRVHTGTSDIAALLTLPDALDCHDRIGTPAIEARLRHLRDRWAEPLRDYGAIEILTPADPRMTCAITSFRLKGRTSLADNKALAKELLDNHRIFTVDRAGLASGACVRVTPALFTGTRDIDRLVDALRIIGRA